MTLAEPAAIPFTRPELVTVAFAERSRPGDRARTVFPATSASAALSCSVFPSCTEPLAGVTETLFTGPTETAKTDVPDLPAVEAVIVALPVCAAVASPLALTLTTEELELDQVIVWPVIVEPPASVTVAVSCWVPPATRLLEPGDTDTALTAPAETETDAVPLVPPAAAVIVVLPDRTAVTRPLAETVATERVGARPCDGLPRERRCRGIGECGGELSGGARGEAHGAGGDGDAAHRARRHGGRSGARGAVQRCRDRGAARVHAGDDAARGDSGALVLELVHDTACVASGLPAASERETESCWVPPATRPIEPGVTVM